MVGDPGVGALERRGREAHVAHASLLPVLDELRVLEDREVLAPRRLVYTWQWVAGVPDMRASLVTVEFHDLGGRTEVVLRHDSFAGPGPVDMYGAGWASGLAKLAIHLGSEEAA